MHAAFPRFSVICLLELAFFCSIIFLFAYGSPWETVTKTLVLGYMVITIKLGYMILTAASLATGSAAMSQRIF